MTEVYKSLNHLNPAFMWDLFKIKETPYNLRGGSKLTLPQTHKVNYGLNALIFRSSLLWNNLPNYIKTSKSLPIFKSQIKGWLGNECSCRLCH